MNHLHKLSPDVVLLDLLMPELDGFGVLQRMRAESLEDVPVVVYTASDLDKDAHTVLEGVEIISKTASHDHLLGGLERAMNVAGEAHLVPN